MENIPISEQGGEPESYHVVLTDKWLSLKTRANFGYFLLIGRCHSAL